MSPVPTPIDRSPRDLAEAFFAVADGEMKLRLRQTPEGEIELVVFSPRTPLVDELLRGFPPGSVRHELCG